jgi:4-amino-4-deoxy-L-arabinose transferase-like glycosyltransferase
VRRASPGDLALLLALLAALLVWPLRTPAIGAHGEAREGLVVQDIVEHGEWVLPHRNGELPSKPPLFHWLAASLGCVLGLSDTALRLPSALAAGVMAGTTLVLGTAIGGRTVGWLAAGALLGMLEFWLSASEARVDMLFAACLTASLAGFLLWYRATAEGRQAAVALAVCWLGAAAAVLAKGPAGLLLPGLVIVAFLLCQGETGLLLRLWSWPLAAALIALDLGWYALAYRAGGEEFLAVQLLYENVDRFLGRDGFRRAAEEPGFRHFVLRMPLEFARQFLPWNLVLVSAALRCRRGEREDASGRFLHTWWIVILAFFTIATGKRSVYLLPLAPALALLAARWLAGLVARLRSAPLAPVPALLALIAIFDLGMLGAAQAARTYHAGRESLAEFASQVARVVPADAPLYAARELEPPGILVLAYRLDRAIAREPVRCADEHYVLVPGDGTGRPDRVEVLVASGRPHAPLALARRGCPARG